MQVQVENQRITLPVTGTCHCAFAVYANVPVADERGRYCSACGHYEFGDERTSRKQ